MGKNKLSKFADMASYPNVVEAPFQTPESPCHPLCGKWHSHFFGNANPIVLELGCGRGEYCVGLARMFPHLNFIGVDIKGARMWTGAKGWAMWRSCAPTSSSSTSSSPPER